MRGKHIQITLYIQNRPGILHINHINSRYYTYIMHTLTAYNQWIPNKNILLCIYSK